MAGAAGTTYLLKARKWPVWILFAIMGGPWIFVLASDPHDRVALAFLLLAGCFCLLLLFMSKFITIYLDDEKMVVSDAWRKRTLYWSDVQASSIEWGIEGHHGGRLTWIFRKSDGSPVDLTLGYYSRADMTLLARFLTDKARGATFSRKVRDMAEGRFPWYLV
jgi:hypothetical protein